MLPLARADDGHLMQVIRPDRPERAVALGKKALEENDSALIDRIPQIIEDEGGRYRFMGYLGVDRTTKRHAVCNAQGIEIGPVEPGDSFVSGLPTDESADLACFIPIPRRA